MRGVGPVSGRHERACRPLLPLDLGPDLLLQMLPLQLLPQDLRLLRLVTAVDREGEDDRASSSARAAAKAAWNGFLRAQRTADSIGPCRRAWIGSPSSQRPQVVGQLLAVGVALAGSLPGTSGRSCPGRAALPG